MATLTKKKKRPVKVSPAISKKALKKARKAVASKGGKNIHYLLILDRSGSMGSVRKETINNFNEQIQMIKSLEKRYPGQKYNVSLVLFNHDIDVKFLCKPTSEIKEFTEKDYIPDGTTALHDACGKGISELEKKTSKGNNVVVVIMTDGHENSSTEYSYKAITSTIDRKKKDGWTISYMGADQDAMAAAKSLHIPVSNSINYNNTNVGISASLSTLKRSMDSYTMSVSSSGSADMENFFTKKKKKK